MPYITTPQRKSTIEALWRLEKIILQTLDFRDVVQKIVDSVLLELDYLELGYRVVVLTLVDEKRQVLKRISLSQTSEAERAMAASAIPFHQIDIPLGAWENLLIKTLKTKLPQHTHYWPDIFTPSLPPEAALKNQKAAGIKTSMLYPIIVGEKAIGVLIFSMVKDIDEVTEDEKDLIQGFTDVVGLAVQNAKLYTSVEEAKEKLESANEKLKELDKLKDEFLSMASHELRTPMTVIKSYLWMLAAGKSGPLAEKQKVYIGRAYDSTERLIKLVNDMLNVSRIASGRLALAMSKVNLSQLVADIIAEVTPRAQELGIEILQERPQDLPEVLADSDKIKEVLINLISNSLKFTPRGGKITISFKAKTGLVETSVTDTGCGIAKDDLPKLFQKFGLIEAHSADQKESGTGLGLYICKSIVELHGGKIWAESAGLGKGAKFTFTLKVFKQQILPKMTQSTKSKVQVGIIQSQQL